MLDSGEPRPSPEAPGWAIPRASTRGRGCTSQGPRRWRKRPGSQAPGQMALSISTPQPQQHSQLSGLLASLALGGRPPSWHWSSELSRGGLLPSQVLGRDTEARGIHAVPEGDAPGAGSVGAGAQALRPPEALATLGGAAAGGPAGAGTLVPDVGYLQRGPGRLSRPQCFQKPVFPPSCVV